MSDTTLVDRLNLQDTIARIDRAQEETRKFVSEQQKLAAERDKLAAEARKLDRERLYAPILAAAAVAGAVAAVVSTLIRAF